MLNQVEKIFQLNHCDQFNKYQNLKHIFGKFSKLSINFEVSQTDKCCVDKWRKGYIYYLKHDSIFALGILMILNFKLFMITGNYWNK